MVPLDVLPVVVPAAITQGAIIRLPAVRTWTKVFSDSTGLSRESQQRAMEPA